MADPESRIGEPSIQGRQEIESRYGTDPPPRAQPTRSEASLKYDASYETVAVADFGSNSTRLVLHHVYPDGSFKLIDEIREPLRLAEHLSPEGSLSPEIMDRTVETARVFMQLCRSQNVSRLLAVATSAVREARNRDTVMRRVEEEAGMRLDILSGHQEAYYSYIGVVNTLNFPYCTLLDLGGGSAEIVKVVRREAVEMASLTLGAITLTSRFLSRDKSSGDQLRRLEKHLAESYGNLPWVAESTEAIGKDNGAKGKKGRSGRDGPSGKPDAPILVGLGGTVRNIAKMYKRRANPPLDLLHGLSIPIADLYAIYHEIQGMTLAQRKEVPGLSPTRADIIVAGVGVVCGLARAIGAAELVVSGRGLRDGLFFSHLLPDQRLGAPVEDPAVFSTRNLMRYYDVGERHAHHVADLALSLFDQLAPLHGLGIPERRLLRIATLLHDVGIAVNYYNHGTHGFYLLTHAGIDGLTHRELILVAYTVAWHSGEGSPFKRWPEYRALLEERDEATIAKLSTLIRFCESLDLSESGNISDIAAEISWDGSEVTLKPTVTGNGEYELRAVRSILPDLERELDVHIQLEPLQLP